MANWISSKLKVAESLLQQIDQQAAESLGKSDRPDAPDPLHPDSGGAARQKLLPQQPLPETSSTADAAPRKLQLKPKSAQRSVHAEPSARHPGPRIGAKGREPDSTAQKIASVPTEAADGDWTQLLGSATRQVTRASNTPLERQRSGKRLAVQEKRRSRADASTAGGKMLDTAPRIGGSNMLDTPTSSAFDQTRKLHDPSSLGGGHTSVSPNVADTADRMTAEVGNLRIASSVGSADIATTLQRNVADAANTSGITDSKVEDDDEGSETRMSDKGYRSSPTIEQSAPHDASARSSGSSEGSESETDSLLSSDSESEREKEERRRRREQINAEKAAEAIRTRENMVAMLEGEKLSLLKILEERKKQQELEVSELQTNMMEKMEAAELEKQRHNSTRMEAFARLAALESKNAELARALANTQWNLEKEVNRVAELQQQLEFKKLAHKDLKQKLSKTHDSQLSSNKNLLQELCCLKTQFQASGAKHKEDILQAEYSFLCDKVVQLKEKAKKMEDDIGKIKKDIEEPTEAEIKLKGRLLLLTDRLIEKQTQVENLSSEKAMLLFKIETMARLYDDNGLSLQMSSSVVDPMKSMETGPSTAIDIDVGKRDSSPFPRPIFSRILSERSHIWPLVKQIDVTLSAGALFLRRNPRARLWSLVYLSFLHLWVIYVLMSHSKKSTSSTHGAVYSIENLNRTSIS